MTDELCALAGFAPQVAWVTKGGTEELEERLAKAPERVIVTPIERIRE